MVERMSYLFIYGCEYVTMFIIIMITIVARCVRSEHHPTCYASPVNSIMIL